LYLQPDHPLAITRALIESQFPSPEYGNYVEPEPVVSVKDNFDDLGFPADHVGRSKTDTYYLDRAHVLRTHTSAHQLQYFRRMARKQAERKAGTATAGLDEHGYTVVADVYRRDAVDRSHYPVFHQMEGARVWAAGPDAAARVRADTALIPPHGVPVEDPNPSWHAERNPLQTRWHSPEEVEAMAAHLKRSLERVVVKIFTAAREAKVQADMAAGKTGARQAEEETPLRIRWVEAYFPFTSPSWELEVFYQGDWLEVLGCGIVKQEILQQASGSSSSSAAAVASTGRRGEPASSIGWAFGIGIERIAMLLFNIPDIRLFWSQDPRFLNQFRAGTISRFQPFSNQPVCYKDVAFWLPEADATATATAASSSSSPSFHENDIMEIVRDVAGTQVEDVQLIDQFTHPKTGRRSCCYRINYRDLERTLTNEEVNGMHERVRGLLVEKCGVTLR
ncbi:Ferredoxin-fold anticodon-binding domain-containing protein 1, partial [Ascosphaera acerosa]